jgi:hypothetical protein
MAKMGPGLRYTYGGKLMISGSNVTVPIQQTCLDKTNFPDLNFAPDFNRVEFNPDNGEFTFKESGKLLVSCSLNVIASQASSEFIIIPEYCSMGGNWICSEARKHVSTAIRPIQLVIEKHRSVLTGDKMRFFVNSNDGKMEFQTENVGVPPHESIVYATILDILIFIR